MVAGNARKDRRNQAHTGRVAVQARMHKGEHNPANDDPLPGDFSRPYYVPDSVAVMGMGRQQLHLLPALDSIPAEFRTNRENTWRRLQATWFFHGLDTRTIYTKPGIDRFKALNHLRAVQSSFEPAHEHKAAAVAYLMSLWLVPPKTTGHKGKPL